MRWGRELRLEQRWKNWAPCSGGSLPSGQDNRQTPVRWSGLTIPTSKVVYSSVAKFTGFTINPWFTVTVTNIWHCWPHPFIPLASPHSTIILPQPFLATFQKSYLLYWFTPTHSLNGAIPLCPRYFEFFLSQTSSWMILITPMALIVYVMMSRTLQPKPRFLLWAHARGKHSLLKTTWIPHKKLEFCVSKAKFIVSSPISHLQPILCVLCFLILERHCHPDCCFHQGAMYHSSLSCFTFNQ